MKIGEVAARAGVTTKAVRYYESLGLLAPARLSNGYRDYGEHEVRLVREVCSLHQLGIPVDRTRPFLECLATGRDHVDDCPASLATYRDTIANSPGGLRPSPPSGQRCSPRCAKPPTAPAAHPTKRRRAQP